MEYCLSVWDPHTLSDTRKIGRIQRQAARYVTGDYRRSSSVSEMLHNLKWTNLSTRRSVNRLTMIYKILNGHSAITPNNFFEFNKTQTRKNITSLFVQRSIVIVEINPKQKHGPRFRGTPRSKAWWTLCRMHMKLLQIHDLPNRTILAPEAMVYLSDQLIDNPSLLPVRRDLLRQPGANAFHPEPQKLNLTIWSISGNMLRRQDFQKELQIWQPNSSESARGTPMIPYTAPILQMVPGETD